MITFSKYACVSVIVLAACVSAQAQHAGDMWIGRSDARQLKWDTDCSGGGCGFNPNIRLTVLAPDAYGGWSGDSPGFDRITADQPDEDLYRLEVGAQIWLEIVSIAPVPATRADLRIDPALYIYEPVSFTFYPYEQAGQVYHALPLGDHQLHKHVLWFVDELDPAFDPAQCMWEVTLRLTDKGSTGYAVSEAFTLRFAIEEPVPGDFDCDHDVDLADFSAFAACFNGPNCPPAQGCTVAADFDGDGDVDLADFAVFAACFNGPNRPPACP